MVNCLQWASAWAGSSQPTSLLLKCTEGMRRKAECLGPKKNNTIASPKKTSERIFLFYHSCELEGFPKFTVQIKTGDNNTVLSRILAHGHNQRFESLIEFIPICHFRNSGFSGWHFAFEALIFFRLRTYFEWPKRRLHAGGWQTNPERIASRSWTIFKTFNSNLPLTRNQGILLGTNIVRQHLPKLPIT